MSRILEVLKMSYERSILSPDGNTLTVISKTLVPQPRKFFSVQIQIQITEKSREEYHFMIYGLGSLDLLRRTDGYYDESRIVNMMRKFNASHNKPITLGIDRNGEFLLFSSGFFPNLPPNPSLDDIVVIYNYVHDMVDFFTEKYEDIKKIVKYFG